MATGDLTASSPVLCTTSAALVTAIGALNVGGATAGAETATLMIVPVNTLENSYFVFKVARAA